VTVAARGRPRHAIDNPVNIRPFNRRHPIRGDGREGREGLIRTAEWASDASPVEGSIAQIALR